MRRGYQEMANINMELAEEGLLADADMFEMPTLLAERE